MSTARGVPKASNRCNCFGSHPPSCNTLIAVPPEEELASRELRIRRFR